MHTPQAFIGLVGRLRASYDLELGGWELKPHEIDAPMVFHNWRLVALQIVFINYVLFQENIKESNKNVKSNFLSMFDLA